MVFDPQQLPEFSPRYGNCHSLVTVHAANLMFCSGSLAWVIPPELFKQGPRDVAVSFSVNTIWTATLIFSVTFEFMAVRTYAMHSNYYC